MDGGRRLHDHADAKRRHRNRRVQQAAERSALRADPAEAPADACRRWVRLPLASDVLTGEGLSVNQAKALAVMRDTFDGDGATKSEWQRSCPDIPERTFHRVVAVLCDKGLVAKLGTHYRLSAPSRRGAK